MKVAGQPLQISAHEFNGLLDSARRDRAERQPPPSGMDSELGAHQTVVIVKNIDEAAIGRNCPVVISSVVIEPDDNLVDFKRRPLFEVGAAQTATPYPKLAITLDTLPAGGIGRAVISGLAIVQVDIEDLEHTRAKQIIGDAAKLESAESGGVQILFRPEETGVQWCAVLIGMAVRDDGPSSPTTLRRARLTEDLIQCDSGAAILLGECGCAGSEEILIHDPLGLANTETGSPDDYAPEGAICWVQAKPCATGGEERDEYDLIVVGNADCCPPCEICDELYLCIGGELFKMATGQSVLMNAQAELDCGDCGEIGDTLLLYLAVACDQDFISLSASLVCGESVADPTPGTGDPPAEPIATATAQIATADVCIGCTTAVLDFGACGVISIPIGATADSCGPCEEPTACSDCMELRTAMNKFGQTWDPNVGAEPRNKVWWTVWITDSAAWCDEGVRRFHLRLENAGPGFDLGGGLAGHRVILPGFRLVNSIGALPSGCDVEIIDAEYPLLDPAVAYPTDVTSFGVFDVPRRWFDTGDVFTAWFDLRSNEPASTVHKAFSIEWFLATHLIAPGWYGGYLTHRFSWNCDPALGACCIGTSCSITTQQSCQIQGGTWQGAGTNCDPPNPCAEIG